MTGGQPGGRAPNGKTRTAAALKYDASADAAPQIVGMGAGYVAENIIKTAKESGVPVVADEKASKELMRLSLGQEIPPELYQIIAEILVFVAQLDGGGKPRYGMGNIPGGHEGAK